METIIRYSDNEALKDLSDCAICPRSCHKNRLSGQKGYCKSDASLNISSICIHHGEEPIISGTHGVCNVFFGHCNLQCVYCQNKQISCNKSKPVNRTLDEVTEMIIGHLDKGCKAVGFVSASHMIPQMVMIINSLHRWNRYPTIIYNTNAYDKAGTLRRLEGLIDIYLPDFKYSDPFIAKKYSGADDYPRVALAAIKEMHRQMGSRVITDENEIAVRGLIIRHLVLPGHTDNSIQVLRTISEEISDKVSISLMSQYYPIPDVSEHPQLNKTLSQAEYSTVCNEMERLGFVNGFVQDLTSSAEYLPDFRWEHPFEKTA